MHKKQSQLLERGVCERMSVRESVCVGVRGDIFKFRPQNLSLVNATTRSQTLPFPSFRSMLHLQDEEAGMPMKGAVIPFLLLLLLLLAAGAMASVSLSPTYSVFSTYSRSITITCASTCDFICWSLSEAPVCGTVTCSAGKLWGFH